MPITRLLYSFSILLCLGSPAQGVEATRGPILKQEKVVDPHGVWLENDLLRIGVTTNEYAGQIMELIYKPLDMSLSPVDHTQGYCIDRMGEDRFFWKTKSEGFAGEIVSQDDETAVAKVGYTWNYDYNDVQTQIAVSKTYRLAHGSSAVEVTWGLKNIGQVTAQMTPWVKHLGGVTDKMLGGPSLVPLTAGPRDPGAEFIQPATDWTVRLSGEENSEKLPMVFSVIDYRTILQQFPWRDKARFTLETILRRITLKPGESWQVVYYLGATPNLGKPTYVAPELTAAAMVAADAQSGKEVSFQLQIAAALDQGEKRLEGEILNEQGEVVANLPNRQVRLRPGEIATVEYAFTPPTAGVYTASLSIYDNQQIVRLGERVNSQRSSITVPLVIGIPQEKLTEHVVLKQWDAVGSGWPGRKPRQVVPFRVAAKGVGLRASQVLIPNRIYPEDRIDYSAAPQPASFSAARGEYEALQFAVDCDDADTAEQLRFEVSDLKQGERKLAGETKLLETIYLTTDTPSGYKNFPIGDWPDPLFEQGWLDLVSKQSPLVKRNIDIYRQTRRRVGWLLVKTSRDAAPGVYTGTINVLLPGGDRPALQIPIELTVRSFALPERPSFRCSTGLVGFGAPKFTGSLTALGVAPQRIEQLLKRTSGETLIDQQWQKSLEYGWTPTMWSGVKMWEKYNDHGRGISVFAGHGRADETAWLKEHNRLADSFMYAPFDEHADEIVPKVAAWCREFRSDSEMPILDCYYGGNVRPLFNLVNVWLGQSPQQPWAQERKQAGDRFYQCNSSLVWHVEYEPITGRAKFWQDFADGADGRYVYSNARWTNDVYKKNWTSGNYMGCVIYPGPRGLATSIRWETMRDGVEDYDYLALLRTAVEQAAGQQSAAITAARKLLAATDLSASVATTAELHQQREHIAELIEKLSSTQP